MTARLVVLISGTGSNAADLLTRLTDPDNGVDGTVVAMGSDLDAPGLRFATERDIPTFVVPLERGAQRQEWGERLIAAIDAHSPDLVILSGFMRLLPANVVAHYSPNLWNTHPAYLPEFPGAHAVADAMAAGVTETGASVIAVDEGVDTGEILAQRRVSIVPGDTEESVHERIKVVERELLFQLVREFCDKHHAKESSHA
ncbi:MAG: phosphoribosylglycinamide formyltransferase [Pontimonas sp.]